MKISINHTLKTKTTLEHMERISQHQQGVTFSQFMNLMCSQTNKLYL